MTRPWSLCVWERGTGSGHLFHLLPVVDALRRLGHRVLLCVKDVGLTKRVFHDSDVVVRPLPVRNAAVRGTLARSHAELMFNLGFADPAGQTMALGRWRQLMSELRPAAVFCDHADGALLAAYSLGLPAAVLGNGFFHPPVNSPFPAFDPVVDPGCAALARVESRVLAAVNAALGCFNAPTLGRLADLYARAWRFVFSFAELDAYGTRSGLDYLGLSGPTHRAAAPSWQGAGEKVFFYLSRGQQADPDFVDQLLGAGYSLLIAAPGLGDDASAALRRRGVAVANRHVDLQQVCADCRLVFSEGNHGTTAKILRFGRVPLLLPRQLEQLVTANRLAVQTLGVVPRRSLVGPLCLQLIDSLNANPAYERNARLFADRYGGWDEAVCADRVSCAVDDLIRESGLNP